MQNSKDLPSHFTALQNINFDIKNNQIIQYGEINIQESTTKAILIAKPKVPSDLTLQSISSQTLTFSNDIYNNYSATFPTQWQLKFINPSTQKQYNKYKKKKKYLTKETQEDYSLKDLSKQIEHNKWVYNILDGLSESQRIVHREQGKQGYILIPDSQYLNKQKDQMHYLAIVNDRSLLSLRDLNKSHIEMLQNIKSKMREIITKQLGEDYTYREYFHYPPTFYHLHIHFTSLEIEGPTVQIQRCHELSQVIMNLGLDSDYYRKATLNVLKDKPL